jgi:uncharacterized phage protein gp47/JayE
MSFILTFSQIASTIRSYILSGRTVAVQPGSVVDDVFVSPEAYMFSRERVNLEFVSRAQSFIELLQSETDTTFLSQFAAANNTTTTQALAQVSQAIAALALNIGKTPNPAVGSTGVVNYTTAVLPTSNLTVPTGAIVQGSNGQQYQTTSSATLIAANASSYFNPVDLLWELPVPVASLKTGSATYAPENTVGTIITGVTGFSGVYNPAAISGGSDPETDQSLVSRSQLVYQGNNVGTLTGIQQLIADNYSVENILVVGANNPLMLRDNGYGGCVDVYIQGQTITQVTETFSAFNDPLVRFSIRPSHTPVIGLVSLSSGSANFVQDQATALSGSVAAHDTFTFGAPPSFPVQITYTYNSLIPSIQSFISEPANAVLGSYVISTEQSALSVPVLIRAAQPVLFDVVGTFTIATGYSVSQVVTAIQSALATLLSSLSLGQPLYQSAVIEAIAAVPGVSAVTLPLTKFALTVNVGVVDEITVDSDQYLQLNSVVFGAA